jgi:hypothetical protein
MKYFPLVFCALFCTAAFSQDLKPIARKIADYSKNENAFKQYKLFTRANSPEKTREYRKIATDATVLELNSSALATLMSERPETIEVSFPYKSSEITVQLYKENILVDGFKAIDQEGQRLNYVPGVYYRGIIKDVPQSLVAFSFFENRVIGVTSSLSKGNIVIGKVRNSSDYLSYADHTLTKENPFVCGVEELPQKQGIPSQNNTAGKSSMTTNCVKIYYEVAHQLYIENASDVTTTLNWITAVHNNISTLYANDNISISLSSTMVWTTPDPYVYSFSQNLGFFSGYRTYFYGDLAHLVNSPSTTSVAFLDSLCADNNYAYSGVDLFYEDVPTYSWTIGAMTHEMGHSFGSPHTHACAWNGNNTAIDGCGEQAGNGGCPGPIPSNGGTIMSYCHLLSTGVNLSKGFGPQPGQLIRNTIDSKWCLGSDCSCVATIVSAELSNITASSVDMFISDNTSSNWNYRIYQYGSPPTSWTNISSPIVNISGLSPNTYYILETGNICSSGEVASNIRHVFLTEGNYCGGDIFMDTGGQNGDYGNSQYIVKTFYPQVAGDKVLLTFTEFDLEDGFDFITVYDGESITSPPFANGIDLTGENLTGNNLPGPFQATNSAGAITVEFESDVFLNYDGWEATLTCQLGTDEFATTPEIVVYPNPTSSLLNIESNNPINNLKVYDMTGRLVIEKDGIEDIKTTLSMRGLSNGMYFVKASTGNSSQVLRVIKK